MPRIQVLFPLAVLSACAATNAAGPDGEDTCNARAHRDLIGQLAADPAALSALAPKVRLIYPGTAVTMDHQPDRMNIVIDERNRIDRITCG